MNVASGVNPEKIPNFGRRIAERGLSARKTMLAEVHILHIDLEILARRLPKAPCAPFISLALPAFLDHSLWQNLYCDQ